MLLSLNTSVCFAEKTAVKKQTPATILTNWMELHSRMVRSANGIAHVAYSRHFSYTAIAAYEAIVHSNPAYRSLSGQLNGLTGLPAPGKQLFWPACLNAAYADMLRNYYGAFGSCNATIDSMEAAQKQMFLKKHVSESDLKESALYGKEIAAAILKWAGEDGSNTTKTYTPLHEEGVWTPTATAAAPFWSENRSLSKDLQTIFALKQPVYSADTTAAFYKMANEVYTVSAHLTPEQKATALYWDDSPNGRYMTVFGHWTSILSAMLKKDHSSLMKAAEAFAKMTIAMHDASILAWKGKYQFNVLRPITYIQQHIDKQWTPLIATPPHPEFPAAHATLSNAAAIALCSIFGEKCAVTDNSYTDIGMNQRTYYSIQEVAKEAGLSRLYGGIHYRYSIEQGFMLGEQTASFISKAISFHSTL
jgi:hypothetical protein